MITNIKAEVLDRKTEIQQFIDIMLGFENGAYLILSGSNTINYPLKVKTTQKSCVILLLYNAIESTITQLLKYMHESIISNETSFFDLNDDLRAMTVVYLNSVIEKKNNRETAPYILNFIDLAFDKKKYNMSYTDMSNYYSLYSGNLDSKEIKSIMKKYGVSFDKPTGELKTIKEGRNKLAHGEVSFDEYGRDLTSGQLNVLFTKVFEYLDSLIAEIDSYITTKAFKKAV